MNYFLQGETTNAPAVRDENALPEGTQWRYSEFVSAVEQGASWLHAGNPVVVKLAPLVVVEHLPCINIRMPCALPFNRHPTWLVPATMCMGRMERVHCL